MDMWVPHKKKNQKEVGCEMVGRTLRGREKREVFNFSFQIFFFRFSSFCPSEFVGINTESALRDEGYA